MIPKIKVLEAYCHNLLTCHHCRYKKFCNILKERSDLVINGAWNKPEWIEEANRIIALYNLGLIK